MATGRIGVTPTLGTRWSKAPAGGTTSLSGLDDNSVALVYSVGYEQVYRNGVLLSRGNDYTATTGNSITLIDATIAGDIIEVFANELVPLTDAISKGQFTAKGALLSATAASTPGVLAVGTNGQYLQADSTASTGLKWAAVSAGAYTELASGTLASAGTTISSISGSYTDLRLYLRDVYNSGSDFTTLRLNGNTGSSYRMVGINTGGTAPTAGGTLTFYRIHGTDTDSTASASVVIDLPNYSSATSSGKIISAYAAINVRGAFSVGMFNTSNTAITSITILPETGNLSGSYVLYGVK